MRYLGGDWGRALQIELLFAALLCVVFVATSGRFRSRLRVFVSKHFFSYRYDYREEWLRFTRTLSHDDVQQVHERTIMALADLVESPGGALWLGRRAALLRAGADAATCRAAGRDRARRRLPRRLPARTGWVVDIREYRSRRSRYAGLELPEWLAQCPPPGWSYRCPARTASSASSC